MPPKRKPLVIVTRKLPDVVETRMRELFDARLNVDDAPLSATASTTSMSASRSHGASRSPTRRAC
jgi:hypothetical protein